MLCVVRRGKADASCEMLRWNATGSTSSDWQKGDGWHKWRRQHTWWFSSSMLHEAHFQDRQPGLSHLHDRILNARAVAWCSAIVCFNGPVALVRLEGKGAANTRGQVLAIMIFPWSFLGFVP